MALNKIKISENLYKGHNINNPMDLMLLAKNKESVFVENLGSNRIWPCATIINLQLSIVCRLIKEKSIFFIIK